MIQPDQYDLDADAMADGYESHEHFLQARRNAREKQYQRDESFYIEHLLMRENEERATSGPKPEGRES